MRRQSLYCERARIWASLALDGEISELERASLRAHTDACPACAAYVAEVGGMVAALRAAPPVELGRTVFSPTRRFRPRVRVLQLAASAAAVAGAVGLGHLAGTLTSPHAPKAPSRAAIEATQEPYREHSLLALLGSRAKQATRSRALPF